jgi:oligoendopeptidase F
MTETLPCWNLTDLYPSTDSPCIEADKQKLREEILQFVKDYRGQVTALNVAGLAEAITRYESLQDILGKISSYGDLIFSTHSTIPEIVTVYQNISEFVSEQSSALTFFVLEVNQITAEQMESACVAHAALSHYAPWLRDVRAFKPYQLDVLLEQLLVEKSITSEAAWIRLYEDISNRMIVRVGDEQLTLAETLDLFSQPDAGKREAAAFALSEALTDRLDQFTLIFNTIIKDKSIEDQWRGFGRPVSSRNLANLIEDEIVDTLAATVTQHFSVLSERYYRLKARMMGKEKLEYWDRNAPLPDDEDSPIAWEEAKRIVLESYQQFSPEMARIAETFFTHEWIDASVKMGKTAGAFSHPTVPSVHPYILMNYQGKVRDVMTLAHELGHGVHQVLAAHQGTLMADTPLTLAETASVFGEQLTFQYLLSHAPSPAAKRRLIAGKIEDMLNTVVRQIAFYNFETALHHDRNNGELSAEAISKHWMKTQAESFGDAIRLDKSYHVFWTYISHFFHTPFYVYAYAFGDCLVNSLYAIYEEEKKQGRAADFEEKYLEMLRSGGRHRHKELLAPFGIDIAQADFWQKGLHHLSVLIDELEQDIL